MPPASIFVESTPPLASTSRARLRFLCALSLGLAAAGAGWAANTTANSNTAIDPTPKLHLGWITRDLSINLKALKSRPDLIFVGDSIVERFGEQGKSVWDHYYAPRRALNLGIGGDQTEQVLWRLEHGNIHGIAPKLAIVMIGQNNSGHNTADEIAQGITAIVQTLRTRLPGTRILLLAISPRRETYTPERELLSEASTEAASRLADNKMVFYLDANSVFLRPDGSIPQSMMADFEHPTELGYRRWAEAIEPTVAALMGDRPIAPML